MQTPNTLPDSADELKPLWLAQLASTATLQTERDAFLHERETFRIELDTVLAERDSFKQSSDSRDQEITRLKLLIEKLQRMLFGKKSEKLMHQIDQLELELEELYIARGLSQPRVDPALDSPVKAPTHKRHLHDIFTRSVPPHVPPPSFRADLGMH